MAIFQVKALQLNSNIINRFSIFFLFIFYLLWLCFVVANAYFDAVKKGLDNYLGISEWLSILFTMFLTSIFFFTIHKKRNYFAIKEGRNGEAIIRFIIYFFIFNSIRALIGIFILDKVIFYSIYNDILKDPTFFGEIIRELTKGKTIHENYILILREYTFYFYAFLFIIIGVCSSLISFLHCIFLVFLGQRVENQRTLSNETLSRTSNLQSYFLHIIFFLSGQVYLNNEINHVFKNYPPFTHEIIFLFFGSIFSILIFYYHVNNTLKILKKKNYIYGFLWIIFVVYLFSYVEVFLSGMLKLNFKIFEENNSSQIFRLYRNYNLFLVIVGFIFGYAKRTEELNEEKQQEIIKQKDLENDILKLENNILKIQFNSLKNQFNPHFIFNSLNFIRDKSLHLSDELSEAIEVLSSIMRYSVDNIIDDYESETSTDLKKQIRKDEAKGLTFVPLQYEIKHIENYLHFHHLRSPNKYHIKFIIKGNLRYNILPFLLINYIENAIKYGELKSEKEPLNININIENDVLYFTTSNKKTKRISINLLIQAMKTQ